MRLIQCNNLELKEFSDSKIPPYAILSHTWGDREVTFADFLAGVRPGTEKATNDWAKITQTCKLAIAHGYEYVWVDTCCIDKSSSAELTEAINSMYEWYAGSGKCFVYLADFDASKTSSSGAAHQFLTSRWFSRGWTLQELIAPKELAFYDSSWHFYGSKASLCADIAHATGIDENVLCASGLLLQDLLASIPVCRKMAWASARETKRPEDIAYSLLGIFGVHMPLIYGEGTNAFIRLQKKIIKSANDLTIFAWKSPNQPLPWDRFSVFAPSPSVFADSNDIAPSQDLRYNPDFAITNKGVQIIVALPVVHGLEKPIMSLYCYDRKKPLETLGIYLEEIGGNVFSRALANQIPVEIEGKRSQEAPIFLSTKSHQRVATTSALIRGHHLSFKYLYDHEMRNSIQLLSYYPEKRWDPKFGFRAKDTPSFVGINTYQAFLRDRSEKFVVVCGFDPTIEPWACINLEGSDLWYAAKDRDSIRVRELAQKDQSNEVALSIRVYLTIEVKPFWGEEDDPKWMQVLMHVDCKRRKTELRAPGRARMLLDFTNRPFQYLPAPDAT